MGSIDLGYRYRIFPETRVGAVRDECDRGRLNSENGRYFSEEKAFILSCLSTTVVNHDFQERH